MSRAPRTDKRMAWEAVYRQQNRDKINARQQEQRATAEGIEKNRKQAVAYAKIHQKSRRRARKLKAIEYMGGVCISCGTMPHTAAMDFHHLDPGTKTGNPATMIPCMAWSKVTEELDKCIMLCSNCHRELHAKEGE